MNNEQNRINSFKDWPQHLVWPTRLAKAGFYYDETRSVTVCFCCGLEIHAEFWTRGVNPRNVHQEKRCDCQFLNGTSDNVSMLPRPINVPEDEAGRRVNTQGPNSEPIEVRLHEQIAGGNEMQNLPAPKTPQMNRSQTRLATFLGNWPYGHIVSPRALAHTGFFYSGPNDRVECFHCGIVLMNWEPGDHPLREHLRHSRHCQFAQDLEKRETIYQPIQRQDRDQRGMSVADILHLSGRGRAYNLIHAVSCTEMSTRQVCYNFY